MSELTFVFESFTVTWQLCWTQPMKDIVITATCVTGQHGLGVWGSSVSVLTSQLFHTVRCHLLWAPVPSSSHFPLTSLGHFFSVSFRNASPSTCFSHVEYPWGSVLETTLLCGFPCFLGAHNSEFHTVTSYHVFWCVYFSSLLPGLISNSVLLTEGRRLLRQEFEIEKMIPVIRRRIIFPLGLDIGPHACEAP